MIPDHLTNVSCLNLLMRNELSEKSDREHERIVSGKMKVHFFKMSVTGGSFYLTPTIYPDSVLGVGSFPILQQL